jgi:hypothetical protein
MADASNVRHDTIVVPERMSPAEVRALAERKAQSQVGDDDMVAFLHLHGSRPVGGEYGTEVEWRYSYQVIPPGGAATDTAVDRSAGASVLASVSRTCAITQRNHRRELLAERIQTLYPLIRLSALAGQRWVHP